MVDIKKKSDDDAKVFDVAKPENAKLDTGSKPMVIGHKTLAGDPSVRDAKTTSELEAQNQTETANKKIVIQPTSEQLAAQATEKQAEETQEKAVEPTEEPAKTVPAAIEKPAEKPAESSKEEQDADSEAKSENPLVVASEEEKAAEREDALEELIKSKKYEVSIKQKSTTSASSIVKALLLIIVLAVVAAAALLYTGIIETDYDLPFITNKEQVIEVGDEQPVTSQATVPVETLKAQDSAYTMTYPETWESKRTVRSAVGDEVAPFTDIYTLPSGTTLKITQEVGGRGAGACQPAADDEPHQEGNVCPTLEYLEKEPLSLGDKVLKLLAPDQVAYIVSIYFTDIDGTKTYNLCPMSFSNDNDPEIANPEMGAVFPSCEAGISIANSLPITVSIEGPDNTSEAYFENEDVVAIKAALSTLQLK